MPKLDLLNQYTLEKATDQNSSVPLNLYLEEEQTTKLSQYPYYNMPDPPKGEYKVIMYSTFGMSTFTDTSQGSVRGMIEQNEVVYAVAGNTFYSIASDGTQTTIATLNTSSGIVKMAAIGGGSATNNQIIMIDGTNGYTYNIGTAVATFPITDPDFPQNATDITSQDEIVIVEENGSYTFLISDVGDTTSWQALNFASKERQPDRLVAVKSFMGLVYMLGSKTCELWSNIGNDLFTFQRREDAFIEEGCAARDSVCIVANSLFGLFKSRTGGYAFNLIQGYTPKVISTKPVMQFLNARTVLSDCLAIPFAKDGHESIAWTFPTDNVTIVYDTSNDTWTLKQSVVSAVYGRWLGNCGCFCYGQCLVGDYNSGKIYSLSNSVFQENGQVLKRQFTTPHVYNEGKRIYISRLQIDVQSISGAGTFLLEMSQDHGTTWESIQTFTIQTDGKTQLYTSSLGASFCFTFRLTCTDNCNFILLGFQADSSGGTN